MRNGGHTAGRRKLDVLLLGQRSTGRLETLEQFLVERVGLLVVVGVAGLHHPLPGYLRVYRDSKLVKTASLPSFRSQASSAAIFPFYFGANAIVITLTLLRIRSRYQLGIGISPFYTLILLMFRKSRSVRHSVYYCLDYYVPTGQSVNNFFVSLSHWLDCFLTANSSCAWNLTTKIESERRKLCSALGTQFLVPLTYDASLARDPDNARWDRWTIAFVGTLDREKGLDLLADALEVVVRRIPNVKIRIIGSGPHREEFQARLEKIGIIESVIFEGFVADEQRMMDIVSSCALGLAPYPTGPDSYAINADPGKLKLYAFCGIPMVSTDIPASVLVKNFGVGLTCKESPRDFADAIVELLSNEVLLRRCRSNTARMAKAFSSQEVLESAFSLTLERITPEY